MQARALGLPFALALGLGLGAACTPNADTDPEDLERSPPGDAASPGDGMQRWPAGTVLAVNDQPLAALTVDAIADLIQAGYPEYSRTHLRRLALTNVLLELAACQAAAPGARDAALLACRAAKVELEEPSSPAAAASTEWLRVPISGRLGEIDFDLWCALQGLELNRWSEPLDLIGRWSLVRLHSVEPVEPGASPTSSRYELETVRFPYVGSEEVDFLDAQEEVERLVDASVLTIVDPGWRDTVPEAWKHRMRADK